MLIIKNLSVAYGPLNVLRGVSFTVKQGVIVAMIGANGAGKTTTLNTISGLLIPISGTIEFEGRRIEGLSPEQIIRAGIAQVPEGRKVFRNLTVHECLRMGGYARSDQKAVHAAIDRMYEAFPRLSERKKQLAGTMSGGEQQMLAFARALVAAPKLLLLDEPSMGLAPKIVSEMASLIRDLRKDGITILLVEQNASLALGVADDGVVLERGRIIAAAPSRELITNESVRRAYLGAGARP